MVRAVRELEALEAQLVRAAQVKQNLRLIAGAFVAVLLSCVRKSRGGASNAPYIADSVQRRLYL